MISENASSTTQVHLKQCWINEKISLEDPGVDPGTSRMQSERSTIWANPPHIFHGFFLGNSELLRSPDECKSEFNAE